MNASTEGLVTQPAIIGERTFERVQDFSKKNGPVKAFPKAVYCIPENMFRAQ